MAGLVLRAAGGRAHAFVTMHIGILSSASLDMLADELDGTTPVPVANAFPQASMIVKELLRQGHRVSLFTLGKDVAAPVTIEGPRLTVHVGRYRSAKRARDLFRQEIDDLVELMRQDPCDVYGAHWLYEFAHAGLRAGGPLVVTVRDWPLQVLRHHTTPYRAARAVMAAKTLVQFRGPLVAISPYMARIVQRWTGRTAALIPNGIEASAFPPEVLARASRTKALVSIANGFDRLKNTATLLRAFAPLHERTPDVELHLIGAGHDEAGPAATWARRHGFDQGTRFLGRLPYAEAQRHVGSALGLVHPSLEESFGRTLIEAMAKGTPVVGGRNAGAVPWVLDGGAAGILVDVASATDLERGMQQLVDDASLWSSLSETGRARASSEFALDATVRTYAEALDAARGRA